MPPDELPPQPPPLYGMNDPPGVVRQDAPGAMPSTVVWFKAYAGLMLLSGVALFALGVVLLALPSLSSGPRESALTGAVMGTIYGGWGTVISVPYLVAILVGPKRWVWTLDMVLIAFGMLSCYCWPLSIPLLIAWNKPEIKAYFGA